MGLVLSADRSNLWSLLSVIQSSIGSASLSSASSESIDSASSLAYQIELFDATDEDTLLQSESVLPTSSSGGLLVTNQPVFFTLTNLTANTDYRIRLLTLLAPELAAQIDRQLESYQQHEQFDSRVDFSAQRDANDQSVAEVKPTKRLKWKIASDELISTATLSELPYYGSFHNRDHSSKQPEPDEHQQSSEGGSVTKSNRKCSAVSVATRFSLNLMSLSWPSVARLWSLPSNYSVIHSDLDRVRCLHGDRAGLRLCQSASLFLSLLFTTYYRQRCIIQSESTIRSHQSDH